MKPNNITRKLLSLLVLLGTIFCSVVLTGFTEHNSCPVTGQAITIGHAEVLDVLTDDNVVTARATLRNPLKYFHLIKPVEIPSQVSLSGVLRYSIALSTFSKQSPCYGLLFLQHLF